MKRSGFRSILKIHYSPNFWSIPLYIGRKRSKLNETDNILTAVQFKQSHDAISRFIRFDL